MKHTKLKTPVVLFDGQRSYHVLTSAGYDDQSCHCGALELWVNKENHQVVIVCDDSITCKSKGYEGLIVILDNPTDCTLTSCNQPQL